MHKIIKTKIVGVAPLIMHNGQTADPLNKYAKALKEVTGKKKKTEADYEEMARIEYVAGLYMDSDGPIIPARLLEAVIIDGARKSKLGKLAQAGVLVENHARLEYDGPRTVEGLLENEAFRLAVPVRIGQQKIVRTRPIFHNWSAEIVVKYLADVLNERDLITAIRSAGSLSGIGDWRPRNGRFMLQSDIALPMAA